jgi:hypothetical protein
MATIFVSYADRDFAQAIALRQWLIEQDSGSPGRVVLGLGRPLLHEIGSGNEESGAEMGDGDHFVCVASPRWHGSRVCGVEYRTALDRGVSIRIARLEPTDIGIGPAQPIFDLFGHGPTTVVRVYGYDPVLFRTDGLRQLRNSLEI